MRLLRTLSLDVGYVGSHGDRLLIARGLNQPLLASAAAPSTAATTASPRTASPPTRRSNASLRVPILGETPTALADNEFTGASAYHSLQVTLRSQVWRGLSFQANYTYSRAANNTVDLQRPEQSGARLGARFVRPHAPVHGEFRLSVSAARRSC